MFKVYYKSLLLILLSVYCTHVVAMETNDNNQSNKLPQQVQDTSWLDAFTLKALVSDLKKPTWTDYERINQALNLLLMYEQSLCALEQLPPILKLMQQSQHARVYSGTKNKQNHGLVLDSFGSSDNKLSVLKVNDCNCLVLHTPEGRAAGFKIRQLMPPFKDIDKADLNLLNNFIPWLNDTQEEVKHLGGIILNRSCQEKINKITGYQTPNMFTRALTLNSSDDKSFGFFSKNYLTNFDQNLVAKMQQIPDIDRICKTAYDMGEHVYIAIKNKDMIRIAPNSTLIHDIEQIIANSADCRPFVKQAYERLYGSLKIALQQKSPAIQEKYFARQFNIFGSRTDMFGNGIFWSFPDSLASLQKTISVFNYPEKKAVDQPATEVNPLVKKESTESVETEAIEEKEDNTLNNNNDSLELKDNKEELDRYQKQTVLPTIKYANRIEHYFKPDAKLDVYHGFTRLVDPFLIKYGNQENRENRTYNTTDTVYKLAGEIHYKNKQRQFIVLHATIGSDGVCYHRGYETRAADMFDNFLAGTFWKLADQQNNVEQSKSEIMAANDFSKEGTILLENNWLIKIWDKRLQATIILYKS